MSSWAKDSAEEFSVNPRASRMEHLLPASARRIWRKDIKPEISCRFGFVQHGRWSLDDSENHDRDAAPQDIDRYSRLHENERLSLRIAISHHIETIGDLDKINGMRSASAAGAS
jgi:hypothetical protein